METRLEAMEQQVFKCQGMVERGLNANHTMITEFTSNHKMDAIDIGKHLSRLYDRVDQLQGQIYDVQNQNLIELFILQEEEAAGMKRKLAKTGFKSPYDSGYDDDDVYAYNSGDDVEDDNKQTFIEKEAHKIREKGKAAYFKRGKFICPYCTTKPKPKDGLYEHLMSHARGLSTSVDDIKIRVEHAALLKALGPI
ncbi:hypothetical protein D1007_23217 [Hordeum vulgare]|nr:hypothetical protein D1007_23217 [Hordeum vulgare]